MVLEQKVSTLSVIEPEVPQIAQKVVNTGNCEQYRSLVSQYDWNADIMLAIMRGESNCNSSSINWADGHNGCSGSFGVLQIACIHFSGDQDKLDPSTNIAVAYQVWKRGGYSPWTIFSSGAYLQYM